MDLMPPMMTTAVMMPKIMPTAMRGNPPFYLLRNKSAVKPLVFIPQGMLLSDADKHLFDFREDYRKMAEEKG